MTSDGVHDVHPGTIRGGCYFSLVFSFVSILSNEHKLDNQANKNNKNITQGRQERMGKNSDLPVSTAFVNYDIAPSKRKIQNSHLPRALASATAR